MRLWIVSDLHRELTQGWDLPTGSARPEYDILIVAGDLMPKMERGAKWLLENFGDKPAIYVPGNHEFYRADIDRTVKKARELVRGTNITVLQNDTTIIDGVRFIGTTLWSDFGLFGDPWPAMNVAATTMTDYRRIRFDNYARRLRPIDTLSRHQVSRAFIERELAQPFDGPSVVVTHHAPHRDARRRGYERDLISAAYSSDLEAVIRVGRPNLWIYGHVHISDDRVIGQTRVISNAKGYGPYPQVGQRWDNEQFDPMLVVEI